MEARIPGAARELGGNARRALALCNDPVDAKKTARRVCAITPSRTDRLSRERFAHFNRDGLAAAYPPAFTTG